jgi:type II secretory pathway pseudopilin PulG
LLGVAVALAGPAVFGVMAAPGGIELNAKGMALAYGIGALIFWTVVSYFSGAGALGAFVAFGTLIYCWHWIPNRTTNFLNDIPGVTTGMIDGSKQFTLNGVVPILTVISLVYAIQLIVRSVQRRRRERAEAERLQAEQEAAQAQQEADAAAVYPVAGSTYPAGGQYAGSFGNSSRYDDLFDDEEPTPMPPRSQADEQTATYPTAGAEQTAQFPVAGNDAEGNDDTVLVPSDRDETTQVPSDHDETAQVPAAAEPDEEQTVVAPSQAPTPASAPVAEDAGNPQPGGEDEQPQEPKAPQQEKADGGAASPQASVAAPASVTKPVAAAAEAVAAAETMHQVAPEPHPAQQVAAEPQPQRTEQVATQPEQTPQVAMQPEVEEPPTAEVAQEASEQATPVDEVKPSLKPEAPEPTVPVSEVMEPAEASEAEVQQPAPAAREQMGQQYRERMEDPEDTGEFHFNAFETQPMPRPAGA